MSLLLKTTNWKLHLDHWSNLQLKFDCWNNCSQEICFVIKNVSVYHVFPDNLFNKNLAPWCRFKIHVIIIRLWWVSELDSVTLSLVSVKWWPLCSLDQTTHLLILSRIYFMFLQTTIYYTLKITKWIFNM